MFYICLGYEHLLIQFNMIAIMSPLPPEKKMCMVNHSNVIRHYSI